MAHLTDGDIDLIVPGPSGTNLAPGLTDAQIIAYAKMVTQKPSSLLTPFEQYAASVLTEVQKVKDRLHSQHLFTDAVEAEDPWTLQPNTPQKVRMIGEMWGYGEISVVNNGGSIDLPPNGNLAARKIATVTNEDMRPISLARLVSARASVMAMGHIDSTGSVYLDSMTTGSRIAPGDVVWLVGMWPLHHYYDSQG